MSMDDILTRFAKYSIRSKQIKREKLWEEMEVSYIIKTDQYTIDNSLEIDKLAEDILQGLKENFDLLEFDFIFEMLTHLGNAPNLLYDDNGHFAVSGMSIQNVSVGDNPIDITMTAFIEANKWKNTPSEALKHYILSE